MAFSGHKMLGPTGIGVLYGKKEVLEKMSPFQGGGEMIREVAYNQRKEKCGIVWNELPWKFEAGTPNIEGAIGLGAAVKYLDEIGMDNVLDHEKQLAKYALKRMQKNNKVVVHGPENLSEKLGIISFSIEGLSSHDVALLFDNYGVMIRSGYHCAQPLHQIFKLDSSARASFYVYNTEAEVDRFIEILKELDQL